MAAHSTEQTQLRLNFLQEAAYLLAASSPSAAAVLGSASDRFVKESDLNVPPKEYETHRREICGACGNVLISGWSCKVSNCVQRKPPRKKQKTDENTILPKVSEKGTAYTCLRCYRETIQGLQPKPRRQVRKSTANMNLTILPKSSEARKDDREALVKTTNASSKQRQKARKGGLQAMLDRNKSQNASHGGFDLMDFAM